MIYEISTVMYRTYGNLVERVPEYCAVSRAVSGHSTGTARQPRDKDWFPRKMRMQESRPATSTSDSHMLLERPYLGARCDV